MTTVVCLLAALRSIFWPRPGVTEANTRRIQVWMTEKEVQGILGGPATVHVQSASSAGFTSKYSVWNGKKGGVFVDFVGDESVGWRVSNAKFRRGLRMTRTPAPEQPPGVLHGEASSRQREGR